MLTTLADGSLLAIVLMHVLTLFVKYTTIVVLPLWCVQLCVGIVTRRCDAGAGTPNLCK
jgi:hypothetical protein